MHFDGREQLFGTTAAEGLRMLTSALRDAAAAGAVDFRGCMVRGLLAG